MGDIPRYTFPDVGGIDPRKLYGGAKKRSNEPDFIENTGRDSTGNIFFSTGICWLAGFCGGGIYGLAEGNDYGAFLFFAIRFTGNIYHYKSGWNTAASPSARIRFNSIMNGATKYGTKAGNSIGAVGIPFPPPLIHLPEDSVFS